MRASAEILSVSQAFVNKFNEDYSKKHYAFEEQFWGTKMALNSREGLTFSSQELSRTKKEMEDLLSDPKVLNKAKELRASLPSDAPSDLAKTLDIIIRTCQCNDMSSSPEAKTVREETSKIESDLEMARNAMELGYKDPSTGEFHAMSSVGLRNLMRTSPDEATRKAAYEGLRSIGPFVCTHGFVDIVKKRNQLAKKLGYVDYYDYKVTNAEGFNKEKLFEILDGLEEGTRPLLEKGREELWARFGESALEPWNTSFMMAGSVVKKMDPYFPFSKSVERYIRSYAALKISYAGATMNLDLLDRPKKYSNGFCHWPKPAWVKPDGSWQPSVANFTSLADPTAVGSGLTALTTLMHEAGHAAHMANVKQPSPLFSQERAPTSVAYAENQSMFLDSLVGDAAWRAKYALDLDGNPIPFEIIEEEIRATHAFAIFQLRAMLAVSYFEKALYELPEDMVTPETIEALADDIELKIQGGFSPRPILSVPHIVSDEASCYYQGYTLAEMSVHQTRDFFKERDGFIVDNPKIGPSLTAAYWECGNSRPFLEIVKELTGKELSGEAWISALEESVDDKIAREREEYDAAIAEQKNECNDLDLDMTVRFVDGDTLIADSSETGNLLEACKQFEDFVAARVAASAATST
jgi:oligoendopeptidase F